MKFTVERITGILPILDYYTVTDMTTGERAYTTDLESAGRLMQTMMLEADTARWAEPE